MDIIPDSIMQDARSMMYDALIYMVGPVCPTYADCYVYGMAGIFVVIIAIILTALWQTLQNSVGFKVK